MEVGVKQVPVLKDFLFMKNSLLLFFLVAVSEEVQHLASDKRPTSQDRMKT